MTGLLTAREVADMLGVSTETTLRWVRRGTLPAFRLPGGALRFNEAALEAWLEERATQYSPNKSAPAPLVAAGGVDHEGDDHRDQHHRS